MALCGQGMGQLQAIHPKRAGSSTGVAVCNQINPAGPLFDEQRGDVASFGAVPAGRLVQHFQRLSLLNRVTQHLQRMFRRGRRRRTFNRLLAMGPVLCQPGGCFPGGGGQQGRLVCRPFL